MRQVVKQSAYLPYRQACEAYRVPSQVSVSLGEATQDGRQRSRSTLQMPATMKAPLELAACAEISMDEFMVNVKREAWKEV